MKIRYSGTQAAKYIQFAEKSFSWKFVEKPALERHLKPLKNKTGLRVLDAGCGTGRTIQLLTELGWKEKNIIGSDISPETLRIAKASFPAIRFIEADLPCLALPGRSLDIVVSNMTFHYLNKSGYRKTIEHISQWLVKGGCLIIIVVHPLRFLDNYHIYFSNKTKKIEHTPWGTRIEYHPKTISDYINVVIDSGFELLTVEEPVPVGKKARENKKEFKKYSSIPTRLMINAVKL